MTKLVIENKKGEKKELDIRVDSSELKQIKKKFSEFVRGEKDQSLEGVISYEDELDALAAKATGISIKELDTDYWSEEKDKVINEIQKKLFNTINFLTSSLQSGGSGQRGTVR